MESIFLENYCGNGNDSLYDAFWAPSLTIYSHRPDLPRCFQETVLAIIPDAFLVISSLFYFIHLSDYPLVHRWTNFSSLLLLKLIALILLIIITCVEFFISAADRANVHTARYVALTSNLIGYVFALILTQYTYRKRVHSSGVLFIFWLLSAINGCIMIRSLHIQHFVTDEKMGVLWMSAIHMQFIFICVEFLASLFSDTGALRMGSKPTSDLTESTNLIDGDSDDEEVKAEELGENSCPKQRASFLSIAFFAWFTSKVFKGFRKTLEMKDIWDLQRENSSQYIVPKFRKYWNEELQLLGKSEKEQCNAFFELNNTVDNNNMEKQKRRPSLSLALFKVFGAYFCSAGMLLFVHDMIDFISPMILRRLIVFVGSDDPFVWHGYLYAVLMFVIAIVNLCLTRHNTNIAHTTGMRVRTALTSAIYRKSLRLGKTSKNTSSTGEIVNLMSVDVVRLHEGVVYFHWTWTAMVKVFVALVFLWQILGPSCLAGAAYVFIVLPLCSTILSRRVRELERNQMVLKDKRIKLMNQILAGIKGLKLYAWEPFFKDKITELRNEELSNLKKSNMIGAVLFFVWSSAALFVTLLNFLTFVLVDENNVLDAETAFVALSLTNIMASSVSMMLPMAISCSIQASVSIKRIEKFLLSEEIEPDNIQADGTKNPIEIRDATFSWDPLGEIILSDVNVTVARGELLAVVGTVGAGKSSFISSILGEMHRFAGTVYVNGSIAYVPQQPWIQNMSVKDNILFSRAYQKRTYKKLLIACALEQDLKILPAGDQTEIGERGINLSGGQKQRVSLARAVYQDEDLYLMDDPLSAVDAHVGKHLFENVIGPRGLLANKTRVLVTNAVTYLPQVDKILVIKDGFISEQGRYDELLSHDGPFADFIRTYLNEAEESDDETENELRQQLLERITSISETSDWLSDTSNKAGATGRKRRTKKVRRTDGNFSEEVELKKKQLTIAENPEVGGLSATVITTYIKAAGIASALLLLVCFAFNIASLTFTNIWLNWWSNDELQNGTVYKKLLSERIGVYGVMAVSQALSVLGIGVAIVTGCALASKTIHSKLMENILKCPMSFFDTTPLGRILNRFSLDMQIVDVRMWQYLVSYAMSFANTIATCVLISYSTPMFMVVVLPITLIFIALQRFYIGCARQLKRLDAVKRSPTYAFFSESLTGVGSIRAYGQQKRFTKKSDHLLDESQRVFFEVFSSYQWISIWCEAMGGLIIFFAALFTIITRDTILPGEVGLSLSFALQISFQLMVIVRTSTELETNIIAVERINEYIDCPREAAWDVDGKKPPKSWPSKGAVEFKNYSTRYREGLELVLKGVTCFIFPGEKVGVVGRTGAGKSSLTLALFRIIEPAGGTIEIDGLSLTNMGLHDVRRRITIIPQDPVLFSGTLRFNLDPSDCYTDEEIWTALEQAHLKAHVKTLPGQLEFKCEEYGENLSVGQRQLVCLARALLRKTKILILDEATAAVDLKTDDLIQLTIRSEFKECTIITIAHRLNTVMDYDRIMVMDNGLVKEFHTPNELLRDNQSIFFSLAKHAGIV